MGLTCACKHAQIQLLFSRFRHFCQVLQQKCGTNRVFSCHKCCEHNVIEIVLCTVLWQNQLMLERIAGLQAGSAEFGEGGGGRQCTRNHYPTEPRTNPRSKSQFVPFNPPPLAQARPRSQKSGQNGGSTPTPCLDKAVHARDTCDSQTGNNIVSHG